MFCCFNNNKKSWNIWIIVGTLILFLVLGIITLAIVLPLALSNNHVATTTTVKQLTGLQYNVISTYIGRTLFLSNVKLFKSPREQFAVATLNEVDANTCHAKCDINNACLFAVLESTNSRSCTLFSPEAAYFLVEDRTVDLLVKTIEYIVVIL